MARRFLTVEDLQRANAREIRVDEDTLVTPQAQEWARQHGIALVNGPQGYVEPAPDRGPDAARAAKSLPHLPEPIDAEMGQGIVVTAAGRNRPGVLAEVTSAIGEQGGNILDVSQKMVEGYFHMVLMVEMPAGTNFGAVKQTLECLGGPEDYVVRVMHERVFRFMHRV